ncbi:hypothetical protein [Alteromonas sp. 14N.309.X.WAT.G.H12]|uniref:hypothetical protein n=1 Tax=Alteromonas sp. 14N.309.X.WAT.G.H12 TaxID=3120824 RepID=UPI002FD1DC25
MRKFKNLRLIALEACMLSDDKPMKREMLMALTGVGPAQVTRTIREYRDAFPSNIKYGASKYYEKNTGFTAYLIDEKNQKELAKKRHGARLYQALERVSKYDIVDAFVDAQLLLNKSVRRRDFSDIFGIPTPTTTRVLRRARERTGEELAFNFDFGTYDLSGPLREDVRILQDEAAAQTFMEDIEFLGKASEYADAQLEKVN